MVAIPTGLLSSGFMQYLSEKERQKTEPDASAYCPHCGKKLK